jgi:hypothetical protein
MHPNMNEIIRKPLLNFSILSENKDKMMKLIKKIAILVLAIAPARRKLAWLIKKTEARKA